MEFLGITRERKDGSIEDCFVIRCEEHNWFYNRRPPIVTGCRECWNVYFTGQIVQRGGEFAGPIDQLEAAIRHAAELAEKGGFDFKPERPDIKIEKED